MHTHAHIHVLTLYIVVHSHTYILTKRTHTLTDMCSHTLPLPGCLALVCTSGAEYDRKTRVMGHSEGAGGEAKAWTAGLGPGGVGISRPLAGAQDTEMTD